MIDMFLCLKVVRESILSVEMFARFEFCDLVVEFCLPTESKRHYSLTHSNPIIIITHTVPLEQNLRNILIILHLDVPHHQHPAN